MVIRAKDQASRVINGLSRSASADFRRLQTAATLTAQRSSIDMAKVRQHYSSQILDQQKVLNNAIQIGNKTRAASSRQAIRDLGIMRQQEILGIRQEQITQQEIMHTARAHAEAKAAAREAKDEAVRAGVRWTAVGVGMVAVGVMGIKALHGMAMEAVEYQRQATLTLTQTDKVKTSVSELQGISTRVARSIGVPLEQLQPALYDIFSSMNVNVKESEQLLTAFAKEAVAGQVSIQAASRSTIGIMNAFHIPVSKVNDVLDFQFQLVRKGVGTFDQFATTIGRAVPSAVRAGQTYQTLGAMMAFLTRNGLSAAMAAASAGRALDAFANPRVAARFADLGNVIDKSSGLSAKRLRELGIDTAKVSVRIHDAQGNFRGFIPVMGELSAVLSKLPSASKAAVLQALFKGAGGTIQAMRYFNVVIPRFKQQNELFRDMMKSSGAFEAAYRQMSESVAVKTEILNNNWKEFKLNLGEGAIPALSRLIVVGTKVLQFFNDLSPVQRHAISQVILWTSVVVGFSGVLITVAGIIKVVSASMGILGLTAEGAAGRFILARVAAGGLVSTLGLLTAAIVLAANADKLLAGAQKYGASIHEKYIRPFYQQIGLVPKSTANLHENANAVVVSAGKYGQWHREVEKSTGVIAENYHTMSAAQDAAEKLNERGLKPLSTGTRAATQATNQAEKQNRKYASSVAEVNKLTDEEIKKIKEAAQSIIASGIEGLAAQQDRIAEATRNLRDAQADLAKAQHGTTSEVSAYSPALERVHDATVRVEKAQISLRDKAEDTRLEHIRLREAQHDLTVAQARARQSNSKSVTSNDELKSAVQRVKDAQNALKEAVGETARETFRRFQDELTAAKNWSKNMRTLLGRGVDPQLVAELAKKGPQYVAQFVGLSDKELQRLVKLWRNRNSAIAGAESVLMNAMKGNVSGYIKFQMLKNLQGTKAWKHMASQQKEAIEKAVKDGKISIADLQRRIDKLHGKKVNVPITGTTSLHFTKSFTQKDWLNARLAAGRMAEGGEIKRGTHGKADDVPIWASKGEYVVNAAATARNRPLLDHINAQKYAVGGPIPLNTKTMGQTNQAYAGVGKIMDRSGSLIMAAGIKSAMEMLVGGPAVARALAWARTQVGKPYLWGGVGPGGYDCSGFMSAIANVIKGLPPHHRLFSTSSFSSRHGVAGFIPGMGPASGFNIGVRHGFPGHMAGTLGGVAVESSGSAGVRVGGGARSARNSLFNMRFHLANIPGAPGYGRGGDSGILSAAERWIIQHESGGNVFADNPTSTAFGLGQLLLSNRRKYLGANYATTNYDLQLQAMRSYIHDRYGTAENAMRFWQAHGYYHKGGRLREDIFGIGRSGRTYSLQAGETVVPRNRSAGGGSDIHIHFHGPVYGGKAGAQEITDLVVKGLATKARTYGGSVNVTANRRGGPVLR